MKWWIFCFCAVSMVIASNVRADDKKLENEITQQKGDSKKGVSTEGNTGEIRVVDQESKKKNDESAAFVDRDGDGINDGKEHRFRSKKKRANKRTRRYLMKKGRQKKSTHGR